LCSQLEDLLNSIQGCLKAHNLTIVPHLNQTRRTEFASIHDHDCRGRTGSAAAHASACTRTHRSTSAFACAALGPSLAPSLSVSCSRLRLSTRFRPHASSLSPWPWRLGPHAGGHGSPRRWLHARLAAPHAGGRWMPSLSSASQLPLQHSQHARRLPFPVAQRRPTV
jgi:hypothetical protein